MNYLYFFFLSSFTFAHSLPYAFDAVRIIAAIMGYAMLLHALLKKELVRLYSPLLLAITLLLALSLIWSIDRDLTIKYLIAMLPFFGTFIAVAMLSATEKDYMRWRHYFPVLLVVTSLYTLVIYFVYGSVRGPGELKAIATDIVYDIVTALPVTVYLLVFSATSFRKWLYATIVVLGTFVLLLTQSRGAFFSLLAGGAVTFYFLFFDRTFALKNKARAGIKLAVALLSVVMVLVFSWHFGLSNDFKDKFLMRMMLVSPDAEVRAEYLQQFDERVVALNDMIRELKAHWGLGIGFGAFPAVSSNKVLVHDFVLDMWISAGLIGLALAFMFIGYMFYRFYSQSNYIVNTGDRESGFFRLALAVSFVMFIAHGLVQHLWFFNHLYIFAALAQFDAKKTVRCVL